MNVLESLEKLRGVSFTWDETNPVNAGQPSGRQVGMIAQEVEQVLPSLVNVGADGYRRLDYAKMTGYLVEVAKELNLKIDQLGAAKGSDPFVNGGGSDPAFTLDGSNGTYESYVSNVQGAADLDSLKTRVTQLEDLVAIMAGTNTLSTSLDPNSAFSIQNSAFNILSSTTIGGSLTVGLVTIDDLNASINSIGKTLKIQNQALADVEFQGGKIVMTKEGNMRVIGDVGVVGDINVSGNVSVAGDATFQGDVVVGGTVAGSKIEVLEEPENPATDSARPTAASIGEAVIPAGETEMTIYSTAVSGRSKVFVTAGQPSAIGARVTGAGRFTIELSEPAPAPLKVNWWIVN